jgi:tRNA-2-methylthio-N6-dimethylallyladenosine synthase
VTLVLEEREGREAGQMTGKSDYLHAVHVRDAGVASGTLAPVRITASGANSLAGELAV